MYVTVLDNYVFKKPSQPAGPTDIGQRFFASFKLFRLDKQYRSLDPVHSANLESLRCLDPKIFPFNHSLLANYKTFCSADVLADPEWLLAPTVVLFNQLRHSLNLEALKLFAKAAGFPIISWRNILHGTNAALLTASELNRLCASHPALGGFFVPGAPACGKSNINTSIGLFNGAKMTLHSITLDQSEDTVAFNTKLRSTLPGELVVLQFPPYSVQVEITDTPPDDFSNSDTLIPKKHVVPITVDQKSQHETIKPWELLTRHGNGMTSIKYRAHSYELAFSITYDKVQSKSFRRLILDLQLWPKIGLTAEKVLVGLSRVETLNHLRILPYAVGQTEKHLYQLKPNELMLHWVQGFDDNGIWCPQRTAQSILKNPLSKNNKNKSTPSKQKQTHAPTSSTQQSSSKSTGQSSSKSSQKTNAPPTTEKVRVVSQFRINQSHAPPGQTDKLFHSFDIPGDGSCLFNSYIKALHLSTTVSTLRNEVVTFIAQDPNPINRLNAMNAHIARETEYQNPNWMNVQLFDPGTDLNPGQLDIRFSALWCQYSDEMRANAWAGSQIHINIIFHIFTFNFSHRSIRNNCII